MTSSADSDTFSYRKGNMIIQCRGQNLNRVASVSSRGNSASFQRNQHFTVQSRTHRRETSPMSMQCFPNHGRPISRSHRPVSPFSVNTFGSNMTMSALDIVEVIKDKQCPGNDVLLILNACKDRLKIDKRKLMEKRRNMYLRRKFYRADDDSGDQGSASSLSSPESRAPSRVSISHIPFKRFDGRSYSPSVSGRRKSSYLKETLRDSTLYNDCTEKLTRKNLRKLVKDNVQSSLNQNNDKCIQRSVISGYNEKNGFMCDKFTNAPLEAFASELAYNSTNRQTEILDINELDKNGTNWNAKYKGLPSSNSDEIFVPNPKLTDMNGLQRPINQINQESSNLGFSFLKDRFNKSSHTYLSQRFNKTINSPPKIASSEELFLKHMNEKSSVKHDNKRRVHNVDDIISINSKTSKMLHEAKASEKENLKENDFNFAKPHTPGKKAKEREKLISKSAQPLSQISDCEQILCQDPELVKSPDNLNDVVTNKKDNVPSDLLECSQSSLRQSFMKRKLFTQTLELTEHKIDCSDSSQSASPQKHSVSKDKNKTRKIVTNQSCLSRDITQDDNCFLNLLHKIVPPDHINNIVSTNKSVALPKNLKQKKCSLKKPTEIESEKCNVDSINSVNNERAVSDSYTDEEIFQLQHETTTSKTAKKKTRQSQNLKDKDDANINVKLVNPKTSSVATGPCITSKIVESFWNTDSDTDMDLTMDTKNKGSSIEKEVKVKLTDLAAQKNLNENHDEVLNSNNTKKTVATSKSIKSVKLANENVNNVSVKVAKENVNNISVKSAKKNVNNVSVKLANENVHNRTTNKVVQKTKVEDKDRSLKHVKPTIGINDSFDEMGFVLGETKKVSRRTRNRPDPLLKSLSVSQLSEINTQGKKRTAVNLGTVTNKKPRVENIQPSTKQSLKRRNDSQSVSSTIKNNDSIDEICFTLGTTEDDKTYTRKPVLRRSPRKNNKKNETLESASNDNDSLYISLRSGNKYLSSSIENDTFATNKNVSAKKNNSVVVKKSSTRKNTIR